MVKAVSKDEVVFKTLTKTLPEGNKEIVSSCPSVSKIIDFVALSVVARLEFIFITLKIRKLQAVIAILKLNLIFRPPHLFQINSLTSTPAPSDWI